MCTRVKYFLVFLAFVAVASGIAYGVMGAVPSTGIPGLWFYSGFLIMLFSMFYIEPHYPAPKNSLSHSIAVLLVLVALKSEVSGTPHYEWWVLSLAFAGFVLISSWAALVLSATDDDTSALPESAIDVLKAVSLMFGQSRVLYSIVFLLLLTRFHDLANRWVMLQLLVWWLLVMTNPADAIYRALRGKGDSSGVVGSIFSVHSSDVFLARSGGARTAVRPRDFVRFHYSFDSVKKSRCGVVVETSFLENEQWFRILALGPEQENHRIRFNVVQKVNESDIDAKYVQSASRLVGLVCEGATIRDLRFEVCDLSPTLSEGDLVETRVAGETVTYQLLNGITGAEKLESRSESGIVVAEAQQLGVWKPDLRAFDSCGWVPPMCEPVYSAHLGRSELQIQPPEYVLGVLPGTEIEYTINIDTARTHHLAILGVTGSGKSYITRKLISNGLNHSKIICIDFTREYKEELISLNPVELIDPSGMEATEDLMARKADEDGRKNKVNSLRLRRDIEDKLVGYVERFVTGDKQLSIFELPDLSNSSFILEFTQLFLDAVFRYAKRGDGHPICIVIEEAHTVIPENRS